MRPLRVAAGQAEAVCGDVAANVATVAALTAEAGAAGVRLLALPEAFLTGYCEGCFAGELPAERDLAALLAPASEAAREAGVTLVVNTPLQRAHGRTLTSVVVTPGGDVVAAYDKQHLSGYENDHLVAGSGGTSIVVDGWEWALSVCYDGSFPEHARAAADDGAHGYLNSAAFFPGGAHRRDLYFAARALDNGFFVLSSMATGSCGVETFIGGSAVYDPEGRPLARLGTERGLAIADLDPQLAAATRAAHPMHADHRTSLGSRTRVEA